MANSKRGVDWYQKGVIPLEVNFPNGDIRCQNCPQCRSESELKRFWCRAKNRMIYDPFQADTPEWCPIIFTEVVGNKEK